MVYSGDVRIITQMEINDFIATGKMTVDGQDINTKLYLSGHNPFILLVLGFKGETSNYACAQN